MRSSVSQIYACVQLSFFRCDWLIKLQWIKYSPEIQVKLERPSTENEISKLSHQLLFGFEAKPYKFAGLPRSNLGVGGLTINKVNIVWESKSGKKS